MRHEEETNEILLAALFGPSVVLNTSQSILASRVRPVSLWWGAANPLPRPQSHAAVLLLPAANPKLGGISSPSHPMAPPEALNPRGT